MKKNIVILLGCVLMASCNQDLKRALEFSVDVDTSKSYISYDGTAYTLPKNNTITFLFSGDPDFISMRYDCFEATTSTLIFNTSLLNKNADAENSMEVLLASSMPELLKTTLPAKEDSAAIRNHDWNNVTGLCKNLPLSTPGGSGTDTVSLETYRGGNVVIAFRYKPEKTGMQPGWDISNLRIETNIKTSGTKVSEYASDTISATCFDMFNLDKPYNAADETANRVWQKVDVKKWTINVTPSGRALNEDWLILGPVAIPTGRSSSFYDAENSVYAISIKDMTETVTSYDYTFTTAGVYDVTFRASNSNYIANESAEIKLTINVTE